MMNFEEIMKINAKPFCSKVTDWFCDPGMLLTAVQRNVVICLIIRYYTMFKKEYHLDLGIPDINFFLPRNVEEYEYEEIEVDWMNIGWNLFESAVKILGWSYLLVPCEDSSFVYNRNVQGALDENELEKKEAITKLFEWLEQEQENTQDNKDMLEQEWEIWQSTSNYIDYGSCLFFWNDKLSLYMRLKNEDPNKIKAYDKENVEIERLLKDIWQPLFCCVDYNATYVNHRYYGVQSMGFTGYDELDFNNFDPNWVIQAFVLDRLLTLVISKVFCPEADMAA